MYNQPFSGTSDDAGLMVEEHTSADAFSALEREWRELEVASGVPFASFDWAQAWWQHLRGEKLGVRDSLSLRTIRGSDGKLVAVAPMVISRRPSVGPICVRQLQFIGADPNITELRGVVAAPGFRASAYRALVAHALDNPEAWDTLQLHGVPMDLDLQGLAEGLAASPDFEWGRETSEFQLPLPDSWETFRTGLPRNIKESLRKCYNSLKRAGLGFRLEVISEPGEVERALERFYRLHAARAARSDTVLHANVFEAPESKRFLNDVCQRFARRGNLRIFQLIVGEQVAAMRVGFVVGPTLYLYFSGYEPEFAQYGVMTTTVAEAIKYAIAGGFERVHLSPGNDVSKTRWRPTLSATRQATLVAPSARAQLTHRMYKGALNAIDTVPVLKRATSFLTRGAHSLDTLHAP
jgi:CelD/BcsL family acetyltransferase involved in cellulose biosynthesis